MIQPTIDNDNSLDDLLIRYDSASDADLRAPVCQHEVRHLLPIIY
jgi:hypothetical protein